MENAARGPVLDAAAKLFAEKGYAGVSLQEAADAAGIHISAAAALFPTVEKLYEAVLKTVFSMYAARMDAVFAGNEPPPEKIELFAEAMRDIYRQVPCFFPLFYRELLNPSPFFEPVVKKQIMHVAYLSDNNIARGIRKGQFRHGINPANATMILAGLHHYYFLARCLAGSLLPEPAGDDEYFTEALKVFLTGLLNPGQRQESGHEEPKQ